MLSLSWKWFIKKNIKQFLVTKSSRIVKHFKMLCIILSKTFISLQWISSRNDLLSIGENVLLAKSAVLSKVKVSNYQCTRKAVWENKRWYIPSIIIIYHRYHRITLLLLFTYQMPKECDVSSATKCCIYFSDSFCSFSEKHPSKNHVIYENATNWEVKRFPRLIDLSLKMFYTAKLSTLAQNFATFHRRSFNQHYTEAQPGPPKTWRAFLQSVSWKSISLIIHCLKINKSLESPCTATSFTFKSAPNIAVQSRGLRQ